MTNEAKALGVLVVVIALVWGFTPIMDRANLLTSNGGIWAQFPDIMALLLVGATALTVVIGLIILWDYQV